MWTSLRPNPNSQLAARVTLPVPLPTKATAKGMALYCAYSQAGTMRLGRGPLLQGLRRFKQFLCQHCHYWDFLCLLLEEMVASNQCLGGHTLSCSILARFSCLQWSSRRACRETHSPSKFPWGVEGLDCSVHFLALYKVSRGLENMFLAPAK